MARATGPAWTIFPRLGRDGRLARFSKCLASNKVADYAWRWNNRRLSKLEANAGILIDPQGSLAFFGALPFQPFPANGVSCFNRTSATHFLNVIGGNTLWPSLHAGS